MLEQESKLLAQIIEFSNHPLFSILGCITVLLTAAGIVYAVVCWFLGISPLVLRLGNALWKRRIAVIGSYEAFQTLQLALLRTRVFSSKRIIHIPIDSIVSGKDESIFLVDWQTAGDQINAIITMRKNESVPIIVYAKPAAIPHDVMNEIGNQPSTIVVNFRGRLMNDILSSLMTTSYDAR